VSKSLDPKQDPARRVLKLDAWPAPDQQAWREACRVGDVLEGAGVATEWAPQTQDAVAKAYGRWLGWLARQGLLEPGIGPADRLERSVVARYVADLQASVAPNTVVMYVSYLAMALRAMVPSNDHGWLREAAIRLKAVATPVRRKRHLLVASEDLLRYGRALMSEADRSADLSDYRRATNFRDGLIIALLAARPIRRGNFAAIEIGRHLVREAAGYRLQFAATETKTRVPLEFVIPEELSPFLDRYVAHYRPMLNVSTGHWTNARTLVPVGARLWVSNYGSAMSAGAVYDRVTKLTKAKFGQPINPHLLRDCAATSTAIEDSDHVNITASILGHTSLRTSERHYNHAGSLVAMRRHQANLLALRRLGRPRISAASRRDSLSEE
jgi:integrase/recombinase XerD